MDNLDKNINKNYYNDYDSQDESDFSESSESLDFQKLSNSEESIGNSRDLGNISKKSEKDSTDIKTEKVQTEKLRIPIEIEDAFKHYFQVSEEEIHSEPSKELREALKPVKDEYSRIGLSEKGKKILEYAFSNEVLLNFILKNFSSEETVILELLSLCSVNNLDDLHKEIKEIGFLHGKFNPFQFFENIYKEGTPKPNSLLFDLLKPVQIAPNETLKLKDEAKEVLNYAIFHEELVSFLLTHFSEDEYVVSELITLGVENGLDYILEEMLSHPQIPKDQIELKVKIDKNLYNLSIVKLLRPNDWVQVITDFGRINEETLFLYLLNSKEDDFYELVDALEKNQVEQGVVENAKYFAETGLKVIARFSGIHDQEEVKLSYGENYQTYQEQQRTYGLNRFNQVMKVKNLLKDNPKMSLDEVFNALNGNAERREFEGITNIGGRYNRFLHLASRSIQSGNYDDQNPTNIYHIENGNAFTPKGVSWFHNYPVDNLDPLTGLGIDEDFNNLLNMQVDPENQDSIDGFKKMVAQFYWKGIQMMPTVRGSSQTMLELHQLLHWMHGLTPPNPSRKWVLPDCVALCIKQDVFVNEYYPLCWEADSKHT